MRKSERPSSRRSALRPALVAWSREASYLVGWMHFEGARAEGWKAHGLRALPLLLFGFTLLKGWVREPSEWVIAHHLLSYTGGPIRRGFIGNLLSPWLLDEEPERIRQIIATAAQVELLLFVVCCASLLWRVAGRGERGWWVAMLFSVSSFVWHTSIGLGYFDALIAVLGIAVVWSPRHAKVLLWLTLVPGVLIHELYLFVVVPLVAVLAAVEPEPRSRWALLAVVPVAAALAFALTQFKPTEALFLEAMGTGASRRDWFPLVMHHFNKPFSAVLPMVFARSGQGSAWVRGLVQYGPPTAAILAIGCLGAPSRLRWALAASTLAVLGAALLGFDFDRLLSLPALTALLAWTALPSSPPQPLSSRWRAGLVVVVLLCLDMKARFTFVPRGERIAPQFIQQFGTDAWPKVTTPLVGCHGSMQCP